MGRRQRVNVYDQMDDMIEAAVLADGQKKVYVTNSTYESDEDDEPINNLDQIAVEGKCVLVGFRDEFWGGEGSRSYRSPVLENPTWLQVCVYANRMIRRTRDLHHVFLEGLERKKKLTKEGIPRHEFLMGS